MFLFCLSPPFLMRTAACWFRLSLERISVASGLWFESALRVQLLQHPHRALSHAPEWSTALQNTQNACCPLVLTAGVQPHRALSHAPEWSTALQNTQNACCPLVLTAGVQLLQHPHRALSHAPEWSTALQNTWNTCCPLVLTAGVQLSLLLLCPALLLTLCSQLQPVTYIYPDRTIQLSNQHRVIEMSVLWLATCGA